MEATRSLPLLENSAGGCSCCAPAADGTDAAATTLSASSETTTPKGTDMTTQTYPVTGMTCGHCQQAVATELKAVEGVTDVNVELVAGGTSTVTVASEQPLDDAQVAAALHEAGDYELA